MTGQQQIFAERMQRIHAGGDNTFGKVYVGAQFDTDKKAANTASKKAPKFKQPRAKSGIGSFVLGGLLTGVMRVVLLASGVGLYINFVGL